MECTTCTCSEPEEIPQRTFTSGRDFFFAGFSASSSSAVKPDYFVQVVHGEKVVQQTGGRLSVPQRVRLRHLKQLGHRIILLQDLKQLGHTIILLQDLKQLGHRIILSQDLKQLGHTI
jgi:hypothetical protein